MYFPYLRGKRFDLGALLDVSPIVYQNTIPIIEPVNLTSGASYSRLATKGIPFILVMNPQMPPRGRLPIHQVQTLIINTSLASHSALILGFIIDQHSTVAEVTAFLSSNPAREKAIIFRHNPLPPVMAGLGALLRSTPPRFLIFDDRKTFNSTRNQFAWHPSRVLLTDGFQRQDRNIDYPASSAFDSNHATWRSDGWVGIGDYLTVGDNFQEGGGQPFVVTLHLTVSTPHGLEMHHFSSVVNSTIQGGAPPKFLEACDLLVNSPNTLGLTSTGLALYRDWYANSHFPNLGPAKKASFQHHIELMSSVV